MNKQLELLIRLQELDSLIIEKDIRIRQVPLRISAMEKPFNDVMTSLSVERQRLDAIEKKKKDKERQIDDLNERIKKLKTRTSEIKTNKEYQAHLKEIEGIEKDVFNVEEEILVFMEEMDVKKSLVKSSEAAQKIEQDKINAIKAELDREVKTEEKELEALSLKRADSIGGIEPEVYSLYMNLMASLRGIAVIKAKSEICHGCNMNIPPQMFVELKKNEEIIQCPQCNRILYYEEEQVS